MNLEGRAYRECVRILAEVTGRYVNQRLTASGPIVSEKVRQEAANMARCLQDLAAQMKDAEQRAAQLRQASREIHTGRVERIQQAHEAFVLEQRAGEMSDACVHLLLRLANGW